MLFRSAGAVAAVPQGEALPLLLRNNFPLLQRARLAWDTLANSWNQLVLGYSMDNQRELMRRIGIDDATWQSMLTVMFTATGVINLLLALVTLAKLRRRRPDPAVAAYARFCDRLARAGVVRRPSEGPADFNRRAAAALPELASAIGSISDAYMRLRYASHAQAGDLELLKRSVAAFRAPAKT